MSFVLDDAQGVWSRKIGGYPDATLEGPGWRVH